VRRAEPSLRGRVPRSEEEFDTTVRKPGEFPGLLGDPIIALKRQSQNRDLCAAVIWLPVPYLPSAASGSTERRSLTNAFQESIARPLGAAFLSGVIMRHH